MHNSKLSVTPVLMHPQSESESSLHQPDEIEKYNKMQVKSHTDTSSETEKDDGHIQEMNYWDEQEDASEVYTCINYFIKSVIHSIQYKSGMS